jgi:hypothetical protein
MNLITLLADDTPLPSWLHELWQPDKIVLLIPIVAIVGGIGLKLAKAIMQHRERIAKIEHGIDPDAKPQN